MSVFSVNGRFVLYSSALGTWTALCSLCGFWCAGQSFHCVLWSREENCNLPLKATVSETFKAQTSSQRADVTCMWQRRESRPPLLHRVHTWISRKLILFSASYGTFSHQIPKRSIPWFLQHWQYTSLWKKALLLRLTRGRFRWRPEGWDKSPQYAWPHLSQMISQWWSWTTTHLQQ